MSKVVGKASEKAQKEFRAVFDTPFPSAKDWEEIPCERRLRLLNRQVERLAEQKHKLTFDYGRVRESLRAVSILSNMRRGKTDQARLDDLFHASEYLRMGKDVAEERLRAARNVRNWARKTCAIKRRR